MKKIRDLDQEFDKLITIITEFKDKNTAASMERTEIESLIQQVHRLIEKLDKWMSIVGSNY